VRLSLMRSCPLAGATGGSPLLTSRADTADMDDTDV
jgi:hypothetical protein